ncbi:MAG: efflux RND transporter periplasmic adaptor subunit [Bacteroidetes bacterium]|nr:efflux RND transporter periplasmic adaptor subunit [Bacteroidota bacterium]
MALLCWLVVSSAGSQTLNLDHYLELAVSNSPLLKELNSQADLNRLDSLRFRAENKMQLNGGVNAMYAPVYNGWGYDEVITNGGNYSALISVNKTITGKKKLQNQLETFSLGSLSVRNSEQLSKNELLKSVSEQYLAAFGDLLQIRNNLEILEIFQKQDLILKKLTEAALCRQTDYLSFLLTLKQQELILIQLKIQYKNDLALLNFLCGIADTASVNLEEPSVPLTTQAGFANTLLFKKFHIDSLLLANSDKQIHYAYQPKAGLFADAGYYSSLAYQGYKNFGTSFGFNVVFPIFDGNQRKIQLSRNSITRQVQANYRRFAGNQYEEQVMQLQEQLKLNGELTGNTETQLNMAKTLVEANSRQLENGEAGILSYLNAMNSYITLKNLLSQNRVARLHKAPTGGYIESIYVKINDFVREGTILFVLKTKESYALGNTLKKIDNSLDFNGLIKIPAQSDGYVTQLNLQPGNYVQEGEELAVISEKSSFVFILDLPYERKQEIRLNTAVELVLPDDLHLEGKISSFLPHVDPVSQTQQALIRLNSNKELPEGLIARVRIIRCKHESAVSLPREAVLSDVTQQNFWIMRMIDTVTAVKTPVTKGIENAERIEILSPALKETDDILLTGNYGLPDTARVIILQKGK